jgi:GTP-binding protein
VRKFIDTAVLRIQAGAGGNGCVSFRREKFVAHGGPDGGDGGNGGDVFLRGNQDFASLIAYFYAPDQSAERGGHGKGKKLYGRNGKDLVLDVPLGTEVHHGETGDLLGDIVEHDQRLRVAKGGKGGLGNPHWKTSTHQAPREHTDGTAGEAVELRLILKLMADIGLVGFPNAGKSSLLTAISDAHPKIGAYPFTTLNPIIGTLIFEDYTRMTMADIPGLIRGAHEGVGLGHAFLRHIERAPYLVYVVDMAGTDQRVPHEDYASLREELQLHMEGLAERPSMVVANKMDLPEAADNLVEFKKETGTDPLCISAETGMGVEELKQRIYETWRGSKPSGS